LARHHLRSHSQPAKTRRRRAESSTSRRHLLLEGLEVLADLWLRGPAVLAVQVTLRHGDNRDLALGVGAAEDLDRRLVAALGLNFGAREDIPDDGRGLVALLVATVSAPTVLDLELERRVGVLGHGPNTASWE